MKSLSQFINEAAKITISNDEEYQNNLKEWKFLKNASMNHKLLLRDAKQLDKLNRALSEYEEKNNIKRKW
ncbi:MAG: hypothetical protein J1F35_08070 [Erysipelotrichales bacterium]|nr:hypothetical protein [Erysipelotrichales bacterium]